MKYEDVLKKARRLSLLERKKLLEKNINLMNSKGEDHDVVIIELFSLIFTEKEIALIDTYEKEIEVFTKIFNSTYGIGEAVAKN